MKTFETLKAILAGFFLLAVFSLPTLTAANLVGVLGESTVAPSPHVVMLGDDKSFVARNSNTYTISYFSSGRHSILKMSNPANSPREVLVQPTSLSVNTNRQLLKITAGGNESIIFNNSSTGKDFRISLAGNQSVTVDLDVSSVSGVNYGTISLKLSGI